MNAEAKDANGWMPVETMPNWGDFLVYQPDFKLGRNVLSARVCFFKDAGTVRPITHWQPLPKPPVQP
jgi:hypothetical protein